MRTLQLVPERTYSVTFGAEALMTNVDRAPVQGIRTAERHASRTLDATFLCDPVQHAYLRAFDRLTGLGAEWFQVGLMVDGRSLAQYKARMVPGSLRLNGVEGTLSTLSVRLEAVPVNKTSDVDDKFLAIQAQ